MDYDSQHLINMKWVFRTKAGPEGIVGKAKLVAKGFPSKNYAETYAPVASITSIKTFLSVVIHYGMALKQIDVKTAFLNGDLKEKIFIKPP